MSLKNDLVSSFSASMRQNGEWLYHNGNVKVVSGNESYVEALVKSGPKYEVSMQRVKAFITAGCTCPTSSGHDPCKHIWAVILAASDRAYLSGTSPGIRAELMLVGRQTALQAPKPPAWTGYLENVKKASVQRFRYENADRWRPGTTIYYVVDALLSSTHDALLIEPHIREALKSGKHGKLKPHRLSRAVIERIDSEPDREILYMLSGAGDYYGYGFVDAQLAQTYRIGSNLAAYVLPQICGTGRCVLRLDKGNDLERMPVLSLDEGPAWEFRLVVIEEAGSYRVNGELARGDQRVSIDDPQLILSGGFVVMSNRIARLHHGDAFSWIKSLRTAELVVAGAEIHQFQRELLKYPQVPKVVWPQGLEYSEVSPTPKPCVRIVQPHAMDRVSENRLLAKLSFDYEGQIITPQSERSGVFEPEQRRYVRRSPVLERAATDRLSELGLRKGQTYFEREPIWEVPQKRLPEVVRDLLHDGWHIEAEGKIFRKASSFDVEVSSGIDWFELRGTINYGNASVTLPQLIKAIRKGENIVQLGDGSFGMLPEEFLAKYRPLLEFGSAESDHIKYLRTQAGFLDVFLAEREVRVDKEFQRAREQLRSIDTGISSEPQPAGFQGALRGYQCEGLGWMKFLNRVGWGGCLADDMGVGKTAQVLALLESRREVNAPPSLVVVPRSLIYNWKQEAARFTPHLSVLDNSGADRVKDPGAFASYNVVLTTYGTLRRDVMALREFPFDYVILDEAQAIKNAASESAKAARLLTARHRLAMSGTPIENHLGELWSLFEFLNPGMVGGVSAFQSASGALRNPDPPTRQKLARAVRPFILRRTKDQVVKDLPQKSEQTIYCELDSNQRNLYDELRDYYRNKLLGRLDDQGMGRARIQILEALLRLRQAACHPALIDPKHAAESSAKLETLIPQLEEVTAEGHKALVFSQFTSFLALLRTQLDADNVTYEYLDGSTQNRQAHVERFQNDPDCKLFLISLKAGGLGLNLTAADYVFLMDPWWNPAVEAQAIDRTHRIGQERPVFAYRLIARDTVEEKVLELQKSKRALAEAIISEDNSFLRNLNREDLEILLS